MRPTAAGEALPPHARAVLAALDDAHRAVREVVGLERGEVRVGGGATVCTYLLPDRLTAFARLHPGLTVFLRETFTPRVPDDLLAGRIDLGVGLPGHPDLHAEPFAEDPVVVVATPELARRRAPEGRLQPGTPMVTFTRGASLRRLVARQLPDVSVVMELGSIASVVSFARAGLGMALVSGVAVAGALDRGELVAVPDPRVPPPRSLHLLHRGTDRLSPGAAALRAFLLDADSLD